MYVPPHARETRLDVLYRAVAEIGFGTLVTVADDAPVITHLPMMLQPGEINGTICGHVSRANPQWHAKNPAAVATFVGPSFYVSPGSYSSKHIDGKVVPTYNYIAVEAHGTIAFFENRDRLLALVDALTRKHEAGMAEPWSSADAPAPYIDAQLHGIIGFELTIADITGAWKLSRNKTQADRNGVADAIAASDDPAVRALTERVRSGS